MSSLKKLLFDNKTLKLIKEDILYEIDTQERGTYPGFTWVITKTA